MVWALALSAGLAAVVAFVAIAYIRGWSWTGFVAPQRGGDEAESSSLAAKTLWDWLQLLIVPMVLAVAAFALNDAQSRREQRLEEGRAGRERAIAADGRRADALRDYLQRMSELVLTEDAGGKSPDSRAVASTRALTVTVLKQLDAKRKGIVVQFLTETNLIRNSAGATDVLDGADLRRAFLEGLVLERVNLAGADLRDADLDRALMQGSRFDGANLRDASLRQAFTDATSFVFADLRRADFSEAGPAGDGRGTSPDFRGACVTKTKFRKANLIGADFRTAEGRNVDFTGAELDKAHFELAKLTAVTLDRATTEATRFPAGWQKNGLTLTGDDRATMCDQIRWWLRG